MIHLFLIILAETLKNWASRWKLVQERNQREQIVYFWADETEDEMFLYFDRTVFYGAIKRPNYLKTIFPCVGIYRPDYTSIT